MTTEPQSSPIVFGTDGCRGVLGEGLTAESVSRIIQAFAEFLRSRNARRGVAIGYDGRAFSLGFSALAARILGANGFAVARSDRAIPTPALSWTVIARGLDAGVMITAGHLPARFNGMKFKGSHGGPFTNGETAGVTAFLGHSKPPMTGLTARSSDMLTPYVEHVSRLLRFDIIRAARLHVHVDAMHGAGGKILDDVLRRNGCPVSTIDGSLAHDFGGRHPDPAGGNLEGLAAAMRQDPQATVGFAFDGDGDRLAVLLDDGSLLGPDETGLLLANHAVHQRRSPGNLAASAGVAGRIRLVFQRDGRVVHEVAPGFPAVSQRMVSERIAVGCDGEGGFAFGEHMPDRDPFLAALLILEMLARSGHPRLSGLLQAKRKELGTVHVERSALPYDADDRFRVLARIEANVPHRLGGWRVDDARAFTGRLGMTDVLKVVLEGECRWLMIRVPEQEPVVELTAEGESEAEVRTLLELGRELVTSSGD